MALFASKRGRSSRAVLRVSTSPTGEIWNLIRDRSVLSRLLVCLLAIVLMIVAVQGWITPFPFRLAQKPLHGVVAEIDFQRVNRERTARARERAAEQVPYLFRNDPAPLKRLPEELRAGLLQVAQANTLNEVPHETRALFNLNPTPPAGAAPIGATPPVPAAAPATAPAAAPGTAPATPADPKLATFERLREIARDKTVLQKVVAEFTEFLLPLERKGLVRAEHFPPEMSLNDRVAVTTGDAPPQPVSISEIQLPQLLAPTGLLYARWDRYAALLPIRSELESWLSVRAPETLQYDDAATQEARQAARNLVKEIPDVYYRGDLLVSPGETIDESKLDLLRIQYEEVEKNVQLHQRIIRVATVFLMFFVLAVLMGYYLVRNEPRIVQSVGRLSVYLSVLLLAVFIGRLVSYDPWRAGIGPLLAAVMILAIAYNQVLASISAFALCLILTLSTSGDLSRFVTLMSASTAAVILLPSVSSRSTLVIVGMWAAITYFLMFWGTAIVEDQSTSTLWTDSSHWFQSLRGVGWCLAAGFLVSGILPFIEQSFGVVTDISLLELGDVSHPLLQELVRRAPGTYNHSIGVASIAETAADSIGANGLLVRVGAYFHDIGKMLKPHYFIENTMLGQNRHENLAPAMSTLIIIGHVKDGVDLAEQHNLPQPLIDFIEQHHGTTLVEFFYHEATKQADAQPDHRTDAEESHFRYPGPKPQTKEAGVLMLADAVEGASRTLSEPTPKRIERLVHDIALKRLLDGQFDESGLTITEISMIEDSLTKSLIAIYHGRIKYPEQRTA